MDQQWWRTAAIYQVYVRSFADASGDGIGDLAGVRGKLGYLAELGVDALWLNPFYPSPMADGGYDVADYRDVDPLFGTLADAEALVTEAHQHGLRVIIDIVPNHTSSQHPWFVEALAAEPDSPARARYIFRDGGDGGDSRDGRDGPAGGPPNDWVSMFGGPAWTQVADGQWYLHLFDSSQPDLDWTNPEVRAEFESILRFWLDRDVDGIRIDVANGLVKAEGLPNAFVDDGFSPLDDVSQPFFDQDGVHDIYRDWRKILDSYPGERIGVAEAWVPSAERLARYLRPDELHQAFNFHYAHAPWSAEAFRTAIDDSLATVSGVGAASTWVLSNHDIQRHVTRFGAGTRLAERELGVRRARAAALLNLGLPGSAYLYQGEELGLEEVLDLPDEVLVDPRWERSGHTDRGRDGCRVPLPWSGTEPPFGFGRSSWLPQPKRWAALTVETQRDDPASMLSLYRTALRLRRDLRGDGLVWLDSPPGVLAFRRDGGFTCAVNFGDSPARMPRPGRLLLASVDLDDTDETSESGDTVVLPPNSATWWTTDS